ncbi:MAG: GatB/YqeY domain-containing protein [Pseudomonadota bacterium]|nr:GatB/YqeY domain-containing protein [Pseudomonadota bacterium]
MPLALKQRVEDDVKSSLRGGDKKRVAALRFVLAAIKQREVDERIILDDAETLKVIDRLAKQRRESIAAYQSAGRDDLVAKETYEYQLIQGFMPELLGQEELQGLMAKAIAEAGASSVRDLGKVLAWLKPRVQGRADMAQVSQALKHRLGG